MPTEPMTATTPLPTGASTNENDTLTGNMNADRINLQAGDDIFAALGGSDIVHGGDGNDLIDG